MRTIRTSNLASSMPRALLVAGSCLWGAYIATMWRTTHFGLSFTEGRNLLWITSISIVPVAFLPLVGLRRRHRFFGVLAIYALSLTAAEVFSRAQELLLVRRYGSAPLERIVVERWWPFQNHGIVSVHDKGWVGFE